MPIAKLNDIEIYYELHGQGVPLVLIAGYTCDHLFWQAMLTELQQHFQVLVFDNRGLGQTKDAGLDFDLATMIADTMALIKKLGLIRPHILGQSMGGAIAQGIARQHADEIDKLIILNSAAKFNLRTVLAVKSLLELRKANVDFDSVMAASLPWFFSSDFLASADNINQFKESLRNNPYPQSVADQERQFKIPQAFDSRNWLHEIQSPTQIIAAEEDIITLPTESTQLAQGILNSKLTIILGGHSSPIEQPNKICEIVIDFLTN